MTTNRVAPVAFQTDLNDQTPPTAPLEMPRQVLEPDQGKSVFLVMSRLFLRNA
jgi:hypothetical protein